MEFCKSDLGYEVNCQAQKWNLSLPLSVAVAQNTTQSNSPATPERLEGLTGGLTLL